MPHRILVIDDHPETLKVVSLILRRQGFEVITVKSGLEGIEAAEAQSPNLVLLDVMMPGIDGYEVCRRFRAHPDLYKVPIIMFTAKIQIEDKWAGFEAGADDYLIKPTDPSELTARVRSLLKRSIPDTLLPKETSAKDSTAVIAQSQLESAISRRKKSRAAAGALSPTAVASHLPDGCLITVMGVRGGSGATTVAANLAATLAQEGYSTILVDLDMVQGHLAMYLNQKVRGGVNELVNLGCSEMKEAVQQKLVSQDENWRLLLARPNIDRHLPLLSDDQAICLLEALVEPGQCVVVDLGMGMGSCGLSIAAQTDRLLICLQADRISMWSAQLLIKQLHGRLAPHCSLHTIMLDYAGSAHLPASAVEDFLHHPLLATVPIDKQHLAQAVNKGQVLVRLHPESDTAAVFFRMTRQLVQENKVSG